MRILEHLSKYDESMTIAQLKKAIQHDKELAEQKQKEASNHIKDKYENKYFKGIDKKSLFGKELNVYKFGKLTDVHKDTDWNNIYSFECYKISFSDKFITDKEYDLERADSYFSDKELKSLTEISEEAYLFYQSKYNFISSELSNLIK